MYTRYPSPRSIPFVDPTQGIFKWATFRGHVPDQIRWRDQDWELKMPRGSTYFAPAKQRALPGMPDDPVELHYPSRGLDDNPRYQPWPPTCLRSSGVPRPGTGGNLKFKDLPIGARFKEWGDCVSNHQGPFFVTFEKVEPSTAIEVDTDGDGPPGMRVSIDPDMEIVHPVKDTL